MALFGRAYPLKRAVQILGPVKASSVAYTLSAAQGSYSLTGKTVTLTRGIKVLAAQGSYSLTGESVTLSLVSGNSLAANQGTYSFTGEAVTFTRGVKSSASQGSYSLNGQSLFLNEGTPVAQGSYSLTGKDVTLTKTGSNLYTLACAQGSYFLRKLDVSLFGPAVGGGVIHSPYGWGRHDRVKELHKQNPMPQVRYHNPPDVQKAAAHMSKLGGEARAASLTAKQRSAIASNAAKTRWR